MATTAGADPATSSPSHPSRKWIILCVLLALAAVGLGIWAFSLKSDNDDKDAKIASQQQQLNQQKGVAGKVTQAVGSVASGTQQALKDLGNQLDQIQGQTTETQQQTEAAIKQAEQAATTAQDEVKKASSDVDKAQAQAKQASAQAQGATECARGYIHAIGDAFKNTSSVSAGIDQAKQSISALNQSCAGVLGS